jgi:hypothetical protein
MRLCCHNLRVRQSRVIRVIKIPLNLPLLKGDFNYPTLVIFFLSLDRQRGARGDFKKGRFSKRIQQNKTDHEATLLQLFGQELRVGHVDTTDRSFALPKNLIYSENGYPSW